MDDRSTSHKAARPTTQRRLRLRWCGWAAVGSVHLLAAVLLGICPEAPAVAQTVAVSGSIPCAGRLQLVQPSMLPGAPPNRLVGIPLAALREDRLPIVFSLRTNCAYEVGAGWEGPSGSILRIEEGSVTAANGGARLARRALDAAITLAALEPGASAVCLRGPAVSRGGNDVTPDNAIVVKLVLGVSPRVADGTLLLDLKLRR